MAGHVDSYGSTNPKQEHPSGWRILGLHTEQKSTKTKSNTFYSHKQEPTKSLPPQQIQRFEKRWEFMFFFGEKSTFSRFFLFQPKCLAPTQRPPDTTSLAQTFLSTLRRWFGFGQGPGLDCWRPWGVGFCCFRWLVLVGWKKPTNPIFEAYMRIRTKLGWNLMFPNFSGWNIKNRLSCHHSDLP